MDAGLLEFLGYALKESPFIAMCVFLLWWKFRSEGQVIQAFKEGAESTRQSHEANREAIHEIVKELSKQGDELTRMRIALEAKS